jgi:hypothetical protein
MLEMSGLFDGLVDVVIWKQLSIWSNWEEWTIMLGMSVFFERLVGMVT